MEERPALTRRVGALARTVGAPDRGERIERIAAGRGFVEVVMPEHLPGAIRRFRMDGCDGRDQVVAALERSWDDFERPMPDAFVAVAHWVGGTMLDVGANTGLYSLLATMVRPDVAAIAFEPFPPLLPLLRANLAANRWGGRVEVVECAISDEPGEAELFIPDPAHGLVESSCSLNGSFKDNPTGSVTVNVDTIDRIVAARPGLRPTFIKVDVESLEHAVLGGARATLAAHRPIAFIEVLHIGDPAAIEAMRVDLDYVDIRLAPTGLVVGDPVHHDPTAWNHMLVPAERCQETLEVLGAVGLRARGS